MPKRRQKTIKSKVADQNQINDKIVGSQGRKAKKLKVKNLTKPKVDNFAPVNQPADRETKFDAEKTDRDKKLFMWVGVSCVMVIFFVAWIFNLKYEFKVSLNKNAGSGFNWSQTKVELDKAMTQVKQGIAEIKKIQASSNQSASSSPRYAESSSEASEPKLTTEQIDLLKGKLLNEVASGTASSSRK